MVLTLDDPDAQVQRKALFIFQPVAQFRGGADGIYRRRRRSFASSATKESSPAGPCLQKRSLFLAAHLINESPAKFGSPFSDTKLASLCCELVEAQQRRTGQR